MKRNLLHLSYLTAHTSILVLVFVLASWTRALLAAAGEAAAPERPPPPTILQIIFSGGPIGIAIMLVLIGLSLTATYLVFEQMLSLRRKDLLPDGMTDNVRLMLQTGKIAEAEQLCRSQPCLLSFVLQNGLSEVEGGWQDVEKAVEDALAEQSARLFRKIEYLSVLANIAPMVGLLGTVVGMVMCFYEVASTHGSAGAAELAEGIYTALVTTVAGLIIAIPSLGAFAIFRNRVDELIAEAAYAAQHALGPLKRHRPPTPTARKQVTPPPPPPK